MITIVKIWRRSTISTKKISTKSDVRQLTMSWAEEIIKTILMKKSTNFKRTYNTVYISSDGRIADEENQIVKCVECNFVAPMSISHEEYQLLHNVYNSIIKPYCNFANVYKK
ncbi:hypothetical protein [Apocheima cinerarium nucleopolyhedrovirus]|uniref:hypothetical protein n=1 Tax=Apocheima cinerarium nucleopolyhedrovirus TaxID=307461 RepID=UPI0001D92053|nr:hypothetical protein [Apocheima cinerarium nucleopolyhedrovirus]ADB84391.1 hypothetical protein [Apocheima cinerarium nucleopolyhedrovirus]